MSDALKLPETEDDAPQDKKEETNGDLVLTLARKERKVKIIDIANVEHSYSLKECLLGEKEAHQNLVAGRMRGLSGGAAIVKDTAGLQTDLIAKCLFDSNSQKVGPAQIAKFPPSAVETLYDECQKLCGIGKYSARAQEEAKND